MSHYQHSALTLIWPSHYCTLAHFLHEDIAGVVHLRLRKPVCLYLHGVLHHELVKSVEGVTLPALSV
jgi:hypothetical protein